MAQLIQEQAESRSGRTGGGPKIAVIGAGSSGFGKRFVHDVVSRPSLAEGTLTLMDINAENLDIMSSIARKIAAELDVPTKIESTTDRREALDGADYVISTVQLYGLDVWHQPMRIARTYGVDQVVGCTTGPGGTFATLRYAPFMLGLCHDMEELCPDALLLHYANPTAVVSWVLDEAVPNIKSIGLCHSVLGTARELAGYIGAPFEETGHWVAGLNHQAWYLRYEWNGRDAYPLIWEKLDDPEIYGADPVRFEILKYFDYFTTESSVHHTDYYPYFRRTPEMMARYAPTRGAMAGMGKDYTNDENWKKLLVTRRETLRREAYGPDPGTCKGDQRRVLRRNHQRDRNQRSLPVQRQRDEHRPDHQSAQLLRRGPLPGRQYGHPSLLRRRPAGTVRLAESQPQCRRRSHGQGCAGGRSQGRRTGYRVRSADRISPHPRSDPRHGQGDLQGPGAIHRRLRVIRS